jgi:hypothetical protein
MNQNTSEKGVTRRTIKSTKAGFDAIGRTRSIPTAKFFRIAFLVVLFVPLLNGCVTTLSETLVAHASRQKYPVIAYIHGVRRITHTDDLQSTIIEYVPSGEIPRNPQTVHGWLIRIKPVEKATRVREVYILPGPAHWGSRKRLVRGLVMDNDTACVTEWIIPKGAEYVGYDWGMSADDPLGEYQKVVIIDDKLAASFRFRVTAAPVPESVRTR